MLIWLGRENIRSIERRNSEALVVKKRKLLLDEYREGMWTREEYREQVAKLERQADPRERSPSPQWDIENGGSLPTDDSE